MTAPDHAFVAIDPPLKRDMCSYYTEAKGYCHLPRSAHAEPPEPTGDLMTADGLAGLMYAEILHGTGEPFAACEKYARLLLDLREKLATLTRIGYYPDAERALARADALLRRKEG